MEEAESACHPLSGGRFAGRCRPVDRNDHGAKLSADRTPEMLKFARSTKIALALTAVAAAMPARTVQAQVVTYNTRSIFLSAISTPTTLSFSGQPAGDYDIQYLNGGS